MPAGQAAAWHRAGCVDLGHKEKSQRASILATSREQNTAAGVRTPRTGDCVTGLLDLTISLLGGAGYAVRHPCAGLQEQYRQHHEAVVCQGAQ